MVKQIAVYGSYRAKIPVKQRYWKKRKDGFRQRYWKKTKRKKTVEASGRYEFHGTGKDLYKAVVKAHRIVPRGFVTVSADKFVDQPEEYGLAENGLRRKSNPKFILGYTDTETVKLDLDNMSFQRVKYWALGTAKQFRLRGFIILKSSMNSYHVVFDKPVSWVRNVAIVAWVCLMTKHRKLTEWLIMQCIKQASTLRLSPKKEKQSPRMIYRQGKQSEQIRNFLQYRKLVQTMIRALISRQ